jgi:hypothetical protein
LEPSTANVLGLDAGFVEKHLGRQVQDDAVATRGEIGLAVPALEVSGELAGVGGRHLGIDHQHHRRVAADRDRRDIGCRSKGSDLSTLGKITTLFDTTPSVRPSGAARATVCTPSTPSTPPASGWFSTTTGWPSALDSAFRAVRVMVSTPDETALGSTMRTVLSPDDWDQSVPTAPLKVRAPS